MGNIDPELLQANNEMRDNYNVLSTDYSTLSTKYSTCMTEKDGLKDTVRTETETLSNEYILKRSNLERENIESEEEIKKAYKSKISIILGGLSFFLLFIFVGGCYLEGQWAITNFPKKIFGRSLF